MQQTELTTVSAPIDPHFAGNIGNTFAIVDRDSIARSALEARIRSGFGTHFEACIAGFMPRFACYEHASGGTGVIGVRRASEEPLYLENYLDRPIEVEISRAADRQVSRDRIAEVGQFVVDERGIVNSFFRDLVPFLADQGYEWVCFTGTDRIRAILKRVGFNGLPIAAADEKLVANKPDSWGTYYEHDPIVIVGKLDDPHGLWCAGDCRVSAVKATGM